MILSANTGTKLSLPSTADLTNCKTEPDVQCPRSNLTQFTFKGSQQEVNTALNGLSVTPPGDYIGFSDITVIVDDDVGANAGDSAEATIKVTWTAVNDGPTLTLPPTGTIAENSASTAPFVFASPNQITIGDVDAGDGELRVTVTTTNGTLTLGKVHDACSAQSTGACLEYITGTGTADASLTVRGSLADLITAFDANTKFVPNRNFTGTASVTMTVNDEGNFGNGGAKQVQKTCTITVSAVNDAPVVTVPATQTILEDTSLVFGPVNPLSVADPDASTVLVTITAQHGTATLSGTGGLLFSAGQGDGTADALMQFEGSIANVRATLTNLKFQPEPNYFTYVAANDLPPAVEADKVKLTIKVDDQGSFGAGGPKKDEKTVEIKVLAVNDPPIAVNDTFTKNEDDGPFCLDVLKNDTDAPFESGNLTLAAVTSQPQGGTAAVGTCDPGTGSTSAIGFSPSADFFGNVVFTYTLRDDKDATTTGTVMLQINEVNDPPIAVDDVVTALTNVNAVTISPLANDSSDSDPVGSGGDQIEIQSVTVTSCTTGSSADCGASGSASVCGSKTQVNYSHSGRTDGDVVVLS